MYTRCPECSTCFRVTDRHLAIAKGKVRCGKCQFVFNAPEHAIDDLPVSQLTEQQVKNKPTAVTPPVKTEIKKPVAPVKEEKITKPAIPEKPKEIKVNQSPTPTPVFKADATMIADISSVDNHGLDSIDLDNINLDSIDLDSPSGSQDEIDDDDDLFDDSFDLNAAIDELTHATDDEADDEPEIDDTPVKTQAEKYIPENNDDRDVFTTDAYDATNANSVTDILNEMEGQLSLDIDEPDNNVKEEKEYDANSEFDFLNLDDDLENELDDDKSNDESDSKTTVDEFEIVEFSADDEDELDQEEYREIELGEEKIDNKAAKESVIDEDELFDQVDLSDFHDSDVEENIVLEEPALDGVKLTNIGKHADDSNVPFQLRNDLEHLNAPSRRLFSPVFTIPLVILLLLLSFSQLAYFRAHELVNLTPSARPVLEAFCESVGCYYSGPRNTKQIQLLSRDVRLHPKEKKALLISAAMINNAYFAQPYPDIHIRLSDISGNVIAERIFNAKTYMGKLSNPFLLMKSKTPVHINFEVVDPGKDAINFEFTFL